MICQADGRLYKCVGNQWVDQLRLCRANDDGTIEDLGPAESELAVDGAPIPAGGFSVKLANGKTVQVSGPDALEVQGGALVLVNAQGKGQIAWAAGQWLSVNAG